ncbi:MAG: DUF1987 domain-containing protein [Spirochaetaceae bacterium]
MINIIAGKSTPRIFLDITSKQYIIEGHSYPENSSKFYEPIIEWLNDNIYSIDDEFILKIKLLYINTTSTKALFYIFDILDEAFNKGKKIEVHWLYDKDNEMVKETGEELLEDLSLTYKIIEV